MLDLNSSISRLFAYYTKSSAKIRKIKDTELLQKDLDKIYKLASDKFEWMSHGVAGHVVDGVYKTKSGEKIKEKTVKDLEMLTSKDVSFTEHIDNLVQLSKIKVGLLPRTFETKITGPMVNMFISYIYIVSWTTAV